MTAGPGPDQGEARPAGGREGPEAAGEGAALSRRLLWRARGLAFGCGLLLMLAQPPLGLWPALFLAWPALLRLIARAPTRRAAAGVGFFAGLGFFASGLYWIGEAFLVEAGKIWWYLPVMPFAVLALAVVLSGFWAAAFWGAKAFWRPGWRAAAALAAAMLAAETARGWVLTGFPWALQSYAWIDTPAMQAAAFVGSPALGALTVFVAAAAGTVDWRRREGLTRRAAPAALALAALAAVWAGGALRLAQTPAVEGDGPLIRLVQPNTGQRDKWAPQNARAIFDRLLALSATPHQPGAAPALVVWPEVAVTFLFDESAAAQEAAAAATPQGASLAVGAVRRAGGELRNALLFYGPDGAALDVYDKRRLAPFGEYVPYKWILGRIGLGTLGDGLSGFEPGVRREPVALPGLAPAAPLICYEVIFPEEVAAAVDGAGWLLQVTNDAWFGQTAGPWQHLAQAQARAIEQGMPLARAANTGVSAMIDPHGRIRAFLPLDVSGALDSRLPAALVGGTVYGRLGDWPFLALAAGLAALALAVRAETGDGERRARA